MKKTPFAGLSLLDPGESLSDDNGAFTTRDPRTTDHFLEIGAKTHRHNEEPGLANPAAPPSAGIIASGGAIPSNLSISLAYTFEDAIGGETMASPITVVSTPGPVGAPQAPPVAAVSTAAGELLVNTYYYALTFSDGEGGETPLGPAATAQRPPGFPMGQVELSGLAAGLAGAGAVEWRLYRAVGGNAYNLLATGDGSEDTFIDDGTHSLDCSTHPPAGETNTTAGISTLLVTVPSIIPEPERTPFINLYASITGDFGGGSLLGRFPLASAGNVASFPTLTLGELSPPPVNLSIGGAHKIDPDTELIDYHWKRPVKTLGELFAVADPEEGDVRMVTGTGNAYYWTGSQWKKWNSGGGGEAGALTVYASGGKPASAGIPYSATMAPAELLPMPPWVKMDEVGGPDEGPGEGGNWEVDGEEHLVKNAEGGAYCANTDAFGLNGRVVVHFGVAGEGSFAVGTWGFLRAAKRMPISSDPGQRYIKVGYGGSVGKGGSGQKLEILTFDEIGTWTLADAVVPGGELALGEYWIVAEANGAIITGQLYDEDPEEVGAEPIAEVERDLTAATEPGEMPQADQEALIEPGYLGLGFAGAPGGYVLGWKGEADGGIIPAEEYVASATAIEFVEGAGINIGVVENPAGNAQVTIGATGSAAPPADSMGFVFCGEDLTKERPLGYACVTWMTEGKPGEEPENMAEHDILIELP